MTRSFRISVLSLALPFIVARAEAHEWVKPFGEWSEEINWDPEEVPNANYYVNIGNGVCELTSTGSAFSLSIGIALGEETSVPGSGHLEIKNDGSILSTVMGVGVGNIASGYGRLLVSGEGAGIITGADYGLDAGNGGTAEIIIERGGDINSSGLFLGGSGGETVGGITTLVYGTADMQMDGAGTVGIFNKTVSIGVAGTGNLTIKGGARAYAGYLFVGGDGPSAAQPNTPYAKGKLVIQGSDSRLDVDLEGQRINIGYGGDGTMEIRNGGKFLSATTINAIIANSNLSRGTVLVTGQGSEWRHTRAIHLGLAGTAKLTIADNGKVRADGGLSTQSGLFDNPDGDLTIKGSVAGSPADPGVLEVPFLSAGERLTANFDAAIIRGLADQTDFINGFSSRTIHGGGLAIDSNTFSLTIRTGFEGPGGLTKTGAGTLTIAGTANSTYSGGTIIEQGVLLAGKNNPLSTGPILVKNGTGLGKSVTTPVTVPNAVNFEETATLFSAGGILYLGPLNLTPGDHTLTLSPTPGNTSTPMDFYATGLVSGTGNLRLISGSETVAATFGMSSYSPENDFSGTVTVGDRVKFKLGGFSVPVFSGTLDISPGGIADIDGGERIKDTSTVKVNGKLNFGGYNQVTETFNRLEGSGEIRSYPFTSNDFNNLQILRLGEGEFSGVLADGSAQFNKLILKKIGPGTLSLSGASTYSGTTTVEGGNLKVENTTGSATGNGPVNVNEGAKLSGSGTVAGALSVAGTVSPGSSPGILKVGGDLAIQPTGVMEVEINGTGRGTTHDGINVGGMLTYGGKLRIIFGGGFTPAPGSPISVFQATGGMSGNFETVEFVGGTGVFDATTGNITAAAPPELSPFQSWATLKGLDPETNGAPDFDADNDGLKNMVEYVLDSDPKSPVPANLPTAVIEDDRIVFRFIRRLDSTSKFQQHIEKSTSLGEEPWQGISGMYSRLEYIDETYEAVVARIPMTDPAIFLRLRVTQVPE
jgi:T5SS/PEP-CTERM-associated repeat protein/autotransporter-associated beta strand protein